MPSILGVGTGGFAIPIHGAFGTPTNLASGVTAPASACFEDFTEVLNAGTGTGVHAIPCEEGDHVYMTMIGAVISGSGTQEFHVLTSSSSGAITVTSATYGSFGAPGSFNGYAVVTIPSGAVGIVGCYLRSSVGGTLGLYQLSVQHFSASSSANVSTGLGVFAGDPVSGMASLRELTVEARVTALSCLLTNTASALNANGFFCGVGVSQSLPAEAGILGESSAFALSSARTFPFVDGAYTAIRPADDLEFTPLDSLPMEKQNRVMFFVRGQDNTPVVFKVEYHGIIEVVSSDPLFPPSPVFTDCDATGALEKLAESSAYLILSENKFHLGSVMKKIGSVAKWAAPLVADKFLPGMGVPVEGAILAAEQAASLLSNKKAKAKKKASALATQQPPRPARARSSAPIEG
jgi:hypothetical protein